MAETATQTRSRTTAVHNKDGKYLTFALAREEYGLEILKVREIIGYIDVTAVPQTPDYVRGVINLRGQVIPVVDLRSEGAAPSGGQEVGPVSLEEVVHAPTPRSFPSGTACPAGPWGCPARPPDRCAP